MSRLADYFVIVGYDHEKERSGVRSGKILQRFPETDWPDTPFIEGIEWFCQPLGWSLSTEREEPKFFVSVLTDIDANRHYCACLCFNETVAITPNKPIDEEEEEGTIHARPSPAPVSNVATITHHSIMYAPKCLVLVSRLDYTETFRNCLGTIYTVYIESLNYPLETLIGNILGCIQVPPPGGPQVRFSIGAGDKQALQPPQSPTIPVTGTCVNFLFQQLGIKNAMLLFCSVMTEQKILFHSKSYSRLTDSCRALVALMYPFRYSHVYIPILPASLIEVLSTPTPFIMGVHSSLQSEIQDMYLQDVIVADIDGGAIDIPAQIVPPVAQLPESLWVSVQEQLTMVLQPELQISDYAFVSATTAAAANGEAATLPAYNGAGLVGGGVTNGTMSSLNASITSISSVSSNASLSNAALSSNGQGPRSSAMRDKEIRAVFMRMFAILLQGYRSCLTLIRIHPKPVIEFHKASFLGARDLLECDFLSRVLDSMFFTGFVQERGPPWRPCDAWDELYSAMSDLLRTEQQQERLLMTHIRELAQILYSNEYPPTQQTYQQRVLRPTEGAFARIHQPTMSKIDGTLVAAIIREGIAKNDLPSRFHHMRQQLRIVPMGPHLQISGCRPVINNTARRLEVLRTCVNCIFENKIADARKSFLAVLRMMNQRDARLALCRELARGVHGNKSMLDNQQFSLVTALMNRALREDAAIGEYSVAAALLPLATAFCRKLCTGVIQFVYTAIQSHLVWKNQQFWEAAFYQDVQMQIKALYMTRAPTASPGGGSLGGDYGWSSAMGRMSSPSISSSSSLLVSRSQEPSALEIAAEQMRIWPTLDVGKQAEYVASEESTLYSQTIHYANRMVSLLIPPDVNSGGKVNKGGGGAGGADHGPGSVLNADGSDYHDTRSVSNSVVESQRSHSEEHNSDEGFDECDPGETGNAVAKMVSRFIDKVCTEGSVTAEHVRNLHAMVPGVIHMHIETLDAVHREMKRVPPVQKPKIQTPGLLPGELMLGEPLRTYLMSDGRGEDVGANYFPAEGALFLTNYRIIFKGSPCDELTCEQSVVRAFPVASLTKEKRLSMLFLPHLGQTMPEGLQLRSSTFQLIKIAFDEEVSVDTIEALRKLIGRYRYPADEFGFFAFAMAQGMVVPAPMHKVKEKNATLKGFAKKTLLRTAKKAGFKQKGTTKRKYVLSGIEDVDENSLSGGGLGENIEEDDGSDDAADTMPRVTVKDVDRLKERSYVKDWQRLGLGDPQGTGYRISTANCNYSMCRSYPAILVAPNVISDELLRGLSRCYKNQRLPVATWRHRNGAVLLRGALPHAKGVIGMLKGHPGGSANTERESSRSHAEQDRYFTHIIETMPDPMTGNKSWGLSDSSQSINSLMMAAANDPYLSLQNQLMTPDNSARNANLLQAKPGNFSTYDPHNKGQMKQSSKWGSLRVMPGGGGVAASQQSRAREEEVDMSAGSSQYSQYFQRVPLFIIGEKNQSKSVRLGEYRAKFIAVDYTDVRHSRLAFKKLTRTCLPSTVSTEPDQTFAVLLEESDWLQQIRGLLQLAGAIVDLMDCQGSTVTLALEDGWDVTAQISALAQLCLDPYYRTIEGFRVLIEKEWLAFGHRFGHRSNLRPNSSSGSPFAPTFLQFLDAVHQIWVQFPLAFEFNDYYLRFLAYHSVSCRFRTFLFDCELERFDLGIAAVDDKRGSLTSAHKNVVDAGAGSDDDIIYPGGLRTSAAGSSQTAKLGHSVFDYIERQHLKSPIFYNFMYVTELESRVLRPQSSLAILELWEYFVDEEMAHGQAYDPELVGNDLIEEEEDEIVDEENGRKCPKNKVVTIGYDSLAKSIPDAFTRLLEELKIAESERGLLPQKWKQIWDKLELPHSDSLTRNASFSSALVRSHGRLLHKRSTLEILMRGRLSGQHQENFSHPHRFEKYAFTTLTNCNYCGSRLWGPIGDGRRCIDCGNAYHEKCADSVPKNCTKYKAVEGGVQQTLTRSQGDNGSMSSNATTGHGSKHFYYEQFSSNVAENRTHEGHLYKRGALLKGWKQRWFVLDSIKHQLRYYDAMEDSHYKGLIDLAEVQSVTPGPAVPVGTKKVDEKAFFDLKTSRRAYNFYAGNATKAQEWIEKIQACLQ